MQITSILSKSVFLACAMVISILVSTNAMAQSFISAGYYCTHDYSVGYTSAGGAPFTTWTISGVVCTPIGTPSYTNTSGTVIGNSGGGGTGYTPAGFFSSSNGDVGCSGSSQGMYCETDVSATCWEVNEDIVLNAVRPTYGDRGYWVTVNASGGSSTWGLQFDGNKWEAHFAGRDCAGYQP